MSKMLRSLNDCYFLLDRLIDNEEVSKKIDFSDYSASADKIGEVSDKHYKFLLALMYQKENEKLVKALDDIGFTLYEQTN